MVHAKPDDLANADAHTHAVTDADAVPDGPADANAGADSVADADSEGPVHARSHIEPFTHAHCDGESIPKPDPACHPHPAGTGPPWLLGQRHDCAHPGLQHVRGVAVAGCVLSEERVAGFHDHA